MSDLSTMVAQKEQGSIPAHLWQQPNKGDSFEIHPDDDELVLNVGGTKFKVSKVNLRRFPRTRLGRLCMSTSRTEFYYDRNPKLFTFIIDLYSTGELHIPRNICSMAITAELEFWDIPTLLVSECCWQSLMEGQGDIEVIDKIDKALEDPYKGVRVKGRLREWIWMTLANKSKSKAAYVCNTFYNIVITISVILFFLESAADFRYIPNKEKMKPFPPKNGSFRFILFSVPYQSISYSDICCWIYFTIEFLLKVVVCPRRTIFFRGFLNLLDLLLIFVVWIKTVMEECAIKRHCNAVGDSSRMFYIHTALHYVTALRVIRVFHIIKRTVMTNVIMLSLQSVGYSLSLLMVSVVFVAVIMGSLLFVAEISAEHFPIKNIAVAFWATYMTMGAVGYGDILPTTFAGYIVTILTACCGAIMLSLPIAVVVNTFRTYLRHVRIQQHRIAREEYLSKYEISEKTRILYDYLTRVTSASSCGDNVDNEYADGQESYLASPQRMRSDISETRRHGTQIDVVMDHGALAQNLIK